MKTRSFLAMLLLTLVLGRYGFAGAQGGTVRGTVNIIRHSKSEFGNSEVVVWLTNIQTKEIVTPDPMVRLLQKDKQFTPHVLAVTVGTAIEFPNLDPFFHDVFSIYHGKPFDLGLYESGAVRRVKFSEVGVSYIFCNIHSEMSAVVVAVSTPHFAITVRDGNFVMPHVPPGQYKLEIWYEHATESELRSLSREVKIAPGDNVLPAIMLRASETPHSHLNKYGETYTPDKPAKY